MPVTISLSAPGEYEFRTVHTTNVSFPDTARHGDVRGVFRSALRDNDLDDLLGSTIAGTRLALWWVCRSES